MSTSRYAVLLFGLLACESKRTPERQAPIVAPSAPAVTPSVASAPAAVASAPPESVDAGAVAALTPEPAPEGMLRIPAGRFTMGADSGGEPDERPAHEVELSAFWLDATEVTQQRYFVCVEAGKCRAPKMEFLQSFGGAFRGEQRPIVGVSQSDAVDYCAFVGKRLPTEAEFERAVRGDDGRRYPWGNEPPTRERAVFGGSVTADVASRPEGRGPYGHFDLAGNVWEWLADRYDPYAYSRPGAARGEVGSCEEIVAFQDELRRTGRQGFTGSNPIPTSCEHAIRGGAYNMGASALRSTNRVHHPGTYRLQMTGMRCAKDAG